MCKKIWNKNKAGLRSSLRKMEVGEVLVIKNKPIKMPLTSIRVTASNISTDLERKYSVNRDGDLVNVTRVS